MIKAIDIRFFTYCINDDEFDDICEITESQFIALSEKEYLKTTYGRHSVFENGVRQVCLTIEPKDYPYQCDLERP